MSSIKLVLSTMVVAALSAVANVAAAGEYQPAPEIDNFVATKTRAQVHAETVEAARNGLVARNDADVERIAALGFQAQKTRVQVLAETREAARLGLIAQGSQEGAPITPTAEQLRQIAEAGERAVAVQVATR
jgi:hypothetical protein